MSIRFDTQRNALNLETRNTTYQMQIDSLGHLLHLYYGRRLEGSMEHLYAPQDCGFSPNPYPLRLERTWSMDLLPQEYSGANTGDYRLSSLDLSTSEGIRGADLQYTHYETAPGKYSLSGMPAALAHDGEAETLSITLKDRLSGLKVELLYGVYEQQDMITRAVRLTNTGTNAVRIEKAASLCLDIPFGQWDMIHFVGRHTMERQMERVQMMSGIQTVASRRGASSHQHNPFVILCDHSATEDHGDCYGLMLVYSGSHRTDVEVDQLGSVRVVSGIHDEQFTWTLGPGETFDTPEVLLTFTHQGLTRLSQTYHRFLRNNICRGKFAHARRPILINNWEATYFDFNAEKILNIARQAKELGVEMMVLDRSRKDVVDYLYKTLSGLLRRYHIEYIKWDMNRSLSDVYSALLPADRQGEASHRYVLGLYSLLDRLTTEFPDVLFEDCSGGGGRFDAAMLAYSPQIWCSDNTDAVERLSIQYSTSFGHPVSSMGAHVSACPNHQTGRNTPMGTRAVVAIAGTFGYEMDLGKLSKAEKDQIREQIQRFHEYYELIQDGDYYRLSHWKDNQYYTAWQFVAPDQGEALVNVVVVHPRQNLGPIHLRLKGLDPEAVYVMDRQEVFADRTPAERILLSGQSRNELCYSGSALTSGSWKGFLATSAI